ncbi:MAG TPA: cyclic nucleotide-binding domain-containing protein [Acidimicrobiales bacterium]|jgi:CRP-like cAMP-binding protein|nr:cyclic nucleotide-binding domain-containing protein [Acidimicrobiales bacterium]
MAPKDNKLAHLSRLWLFSSLSKKELATLGKRADEVEVPAGKVLTVEGKPGHEFFMIIDGTATVNRNGRDVTTLGPGQYFGELSLLDRGPRSATVTAASDMTLLVLGQREFSGVLDEVPGLAHKLLAAMAEKLRDSWAAVFG